MSFSLGTFLRKAGGAVLGAAEAVPGLGTAVKVGEAIEQKVFPPGTSAAGVAERVAPAAAVAAALPAAALVAHSLGKHHHGPRRHRRSRIGPVRVHHRRRRLYVRHRARHHKRRRMTALQAKYFGKRRHRRKAA